MEIRLIPAWSQNRRVKRPQESFGIAEMVVTFGAQDALHLSAEIRIVLRGGPDRKNQVIRVNIRDPSFRAPGSKKRRLFINQTAKRPLDLVQDSGRALHDLIGKQAAFPWEITAHLKLALNIADDFFDRVTASIDGDQGVEPGFQKRRQHFGIDRLFRREIVQKVRLGETGCFGDLVQRRATKALDRENIEGGVKYGLAVLGLNTGARVSGRQGFSPGSRRLTGHMPLLACS